MENAVKIIHAIGSQWPFLLVSFLIIVFIVKWKAIWQLANSVTQIKLKKGENEVELHRELKFTESKSVVPTPLHSGSIPTIKEITLEEKITVSGEGESELAAYLKAIHGKDFATADGLFEKVWKQLGSDYSSSKIEHNYKLYAKGYKEAFSRIEKEAKESVDEKLRSKAMYKLGLCYKRSNNYDKAIELIKASLKLAQDEDTVNDNIIALSNIYMSINDKDNSTGSILDNIHLIRSDYLLSKLYKTLAEIYDHFGETLFKAIAYQKALEHSPTDDVLMFEAAYTYSNIDSFEDLSILLYKNVILVGASEDSATFNNLGVAYENLGLLFKSISNYKKAYKHGDSLSGANLAKLLIKAGFSDEAESFLNVREVEGFSNGSTDIHNSVYATINDLKQKIEDEDEKENRLSKPRSEKYNFFSQFGSALFSANDRNFSNINLMNSSIPVSLELNDGEIVFSWETSSTENQKILARINNTAFVGKYYKIDNSLYPEIQNIYGFFDKQNNAKFIVITESGNEYFEFTCVQQ